MVDPAASGASQIKEGETLTSKIRRVLYNILEMT
jgi:hypothetical protein